MKFKIEAIAAAHELPPQAAVSSSYFGFTTSERVHIIAETYGGEIVNSCGVYDYKNQKWLALTAGIKTVLYWLKAEIV